MTGPARRLVVAPAPPVRAQIQDRVILRAGPPPPPVRPPGGGGGGGGGGRGNGGDDDAGKPTPNLPDRLELVLCLLGWAMYLVAGFLGLRAGGWWLILPFAPPVAVFAGLGYMAVDDRRRRAVRRGERPVWDALSVDPPGTTRTAVDLAVTLGMSVRHTRRVLRHLRAFHVVTEHPGGRWAVVEHRRRRWSEWADPDDDPQSDHYPRPAGELPDLASLPDSVADLPADLRLNGG